MASAGIIGMLDRVRDAYNVDRVAQVAAQAAFEETCHTLSRTTPAGDRDPCSDARAARYARLVYLSVGGQLPVHRADKMQPASRARTVAASLFEHLKQIAAYWCAISPNSSFNLLFHPRQHRN